MGVVVGPEIIKLSRQIKRIPERRVIKMLTSDGADNPLDKRVRHWGVGYGLDFTDLQNSQIRLPAMRFEQRVVVSAQTIGRVTARDCLIEHSAHADAINITSVDTKPDDTSAPLSPRTGLGQWVASPKLRKQLEISVFGQESFNAVCQT